MGGFFVLKRVGYKSIYSLAAAGVSERKENMALKERTLVCMIFRDGYVGMRTVSRARKSPHRFYIPWHSLEDLEHRSEIIVQDIRSFAVLHRDIEAGTIAIEVTWLGEKGDGVEGYQDTITLPYEKIMDCMRKSKEEGEPVVWKTLSMDGSRELPRIVFKSRENLRAVLENGTIRRKLVRFLRDQFRWAGTDEVEIYDDTVPYSFGFREIIAGKPGISGGLILHGQEDMRTAYYSMHT